MRAKRIYLTLIAFLMATLMTGCIRNDIPYPVVKLAVESIEVEGTSGPCVINEVARTVTIPLLETTDIRNVKITNIAYTAKARPSEEMVGTFDLRTPKYLTLSLYQDYEWEIRAEQNIERTFTIRGQMGTTEWDLENLVATAYMRNDFDLSNVEVTALKLGPEGITEMSPATAELTNFNSVRFVDVTYHNRSEHWSLYVIPKELQVEIRNVCAGTKVAWIDVAGIAETDMGLRYRQKGDSEWQTIPQKWIEFNGGNFMAIVRSLQPETTYEAVAYSDANTSDIVEFTTSGIYNLPNADMEDWNYKDNKTWCPTSSLLDATWDSGNHATAGIGAGNLTSPSEDVRPGSTGKKSAYMASMKASIMGVGKFAAGNLFVGTFVQIDGMGGIVDFGKPMGTSARPTGIRLWMKSNCGTINEGNHTTGIDLTNIFACVCDRTEPYRVNTNKEETLFNPQSAPGVIAYGIYESKTSVPTWTEITIPFTYKDFTTEPNYFVFTLTCSGYGDYFTGSTQSWMYIDDIEILYDLDDDGNCK
ncbi:MAG: hypothetical protein E7130_04375 [Rikenellaceae bacterium]|nr:hypothetical protein [Rikenellaceae bacterium]